MTKEEKELLFKDLCSRLPYGVIVQYKQKTFEPYGEYTVDVKIEIDDMLHHRLKCLDFKPYLRTVEDMSAEELLEYHRRCICIHEGAKHLWYDTPNSIDYLNRIHVDYRGLIPMGLALEAKEGMYN